MNNYQKAIKVRKECENQKSCYGCDYNSKCINSDILWFSPTCEEIKLIAKAIKEEKWNVK